MSKKGNSLQALKQDTREYEAEILALQSLSLIAASDPQDDLSDEELLAYFKKHKFETGMIQQIIQSVQAL